MSTKEINRRYYLKNQVRLRAARREKYKKNPETELRQQRKRYAANPAKYRARARARSATVSGRARILWYGAKRRAKLRKQGFDLSVARIERAIKRGLCEATGIPFDLSPRSAGGQNPFSPSLDQKVRGGGYTNENTQVVIYIHNCARWTWGDAPLKKYIDEAKFLR